MAGYSLRHAFSVPSQHATGMLTPQRGRLQKLPTYKEADKSAQHRRRQLKAPLIEGGALEGRGEYRESVDYKRPGAGSTAALCVACP